MLREPVHPEFVRALAALDFQGLSYAEAWRRLAPVAARLGLPRPSYPTVRRALVMVRRVEAARRERREEILADLFSGRVPRMVP